MASKAEKRVFCSAGRSGVVAIKGDTISRTRWRLRVRLRLRDGPYVEHKFGLMPKQAMRSYLGC
eukprot:scaffold364687_cov39-Prasinocladus_malaysianus.AAC.1